MGLEEAELGGLRINRVWDCFVGRLCPQDQLV